MTSDVFTKPSKNTMYLEDVDEWESEHLLLDDILLQKANKIMIVDWLHDISQYLFQMIFHL